MYTRFACNWSLSLKNLCFFPLKKWVTFTKSMWEGFAPQWNPSWFVNLKNKASKKLGEERVLCVAVTTFLLLNDLTREWKASCSATRNVMHNVTAIYLQIHETYYNLTRVVRLDTVFWEKALDLPVKNPSLYKSVFALSLHAGSSAWISVWRTYRVRKRGFAPVNMWLFWHLSFCIIQAHITHLVRTTTVYVLTRNTYTLYLQSIKARRGLMFIMAAFCGKTGETGQVRPVSLERGHLVAVSSLCLLLNLLLSTALVFPL